MSSTVEVINIPRRFAAEEWGGSETCITETSLRLPDYGYTPRIMTTTALSQTPREQFQGIPVERYSYFYPYFGLSKEAKALLDRKAGNLFSFSLMRALKNRRPGIIHLHTGKRLGAIGRYCAMKLKIPYVITLHGGLYSVPQGEQDSWTEPTSGALEWGKILGWMVGSRRVIHDASAVICVGKDEYDAVSGSFPDKMVEYLPNGVDIHRFSDGDGTAFRKIHNIPEDRFLFLTTARFDNQKNQLALLRVLKRALKTIPQAHLLLIGAVTNSSYYDSIIAEARQSGTEDRVTLIPGISYHDRQLIDAYHAADSFILPSLHEPFGMVILEAWASGLPAAASRRGGLPSVISHGNTGLLFDPEDPEDILAAMQTLYADADLRVRLAGAGHKEAVEKYSWDAVTARLAEIYRSVYANFIP